MKNKIVLSLLVSSISLSGVYAMEMTTNGDTMMKDKTMDSEKMVKSMTPTSDAGVGSRGEHVTIIQKFLIEKGFLTLPTGAVHGYYGMITKKAVMSYQESIGVTPTGFFGPKTRMMMQDKMKMMDNGKMMKKDEGMMKDKMVQ